MVIAYHLIWTMYGWWLPNDIRGSMSTFVHSDVIFDLGDLHYGRKRVQLGLRPADHPVWGGPGWKVFLDTPDDIRRTIRYVYDNPKKMRLLDQHWEFVTPYDNWPFHDR